MADAAERGRWDKLSSLMALTVNCVPRGKDDTRPPATAAEYNPFSPENQERGKQAAMSAEPTPEEIALNWNAFKTIVTTGRFAP
jgi:hypothetical protein